MLLSLTLFLNDLDANLAVVNQALHQRIRLKDTFRGEFLKVAVDNCLQFIQRSVRPGK